MLVFECVCVYLFKRSKTCISSWWFFTWRTRMYFISSRRFFTWWAGGASSPFSLAPTKTLNDAGDITTDHRDVPAISLWLTWWSCWNIGHEGWISFSQAVCFTIKKQGTSSFMTSALDALVFVQVCNLWWVSDKVPQGRGVVSVQLLSRITPDYSNRMSNLHTLIGNSFK